MIPSPGSATLKIAQDSNSWPSPSILIPTSRFLLLPSISLAPWLALLPQIAATIFSVRCSFSGNKTRDHQLLPTIFHLAFSGKALWRSPPNQPMEQINSLQAYLFLPHFHPLLFRIEGNALQDRDYPLTKPQRRKSCRYHPASPKFSQQPQDKEENEKEKIHPKEHKKPKTDLLFSKSNYKESENQPQKTL